MNTTLWKIESDINEVILGMNYALDTANLAFETYFADVQGFCNGNSRLESYESALHIILDRLYDEKAKLEALNERLFQYASKGVQE